MALSRFTMSAMVSPTRKARLAILAGLSACVPMAAWGQVAGGLLPAIGASGVSSGLRDTVNSALPGAPTVNIGLPWTYSASLGVDVGVTQTSYSNSGNGNYGLYGNNSGTSFTTILSPEIDITGDTPRLAVRLSYAPQIDLYAGGNNTQQSYVAQNLNGSATATIIPDTLFVDLRAIAAQTSRFGGTQYLPNQLVNSNDAVQTYSFSVSPRLEHRFGGWGTFRAAYTLQRTTQDGDGNDYNGVYPVGTTANVVGANPYYTGGYGTTGNLTTNTETASFVTGENLSRIQYEFDASGAQYGGGGVTYQGSYQYTINNVLRFALNHSISIFGSVGYEWLNYGSDGGYALGNSYRLDDLIWSVGTTLNPNPDLNFTIQYGRSYGNNTLQFAGDYAITARLRVSANYSIGVTTGVQQLQQLLSTTAVGVGGTLIDTRTGLPVVGANAFGSQYGLSRVKALSVSAFYIVNREAFSASVTNQMQTTLVNSTSVNGYVVPANTSSSSTVGSISWQHDLNPSTSFNATGSYGVVDNGSLLGNSNSSQTTYGFSAALTHIFTDTLTGHITYGYSRVTGEQALYDAYGANYSQNILLAGLRKTF